MEERSGLVKERDVGGEKYLQSDQLFELFWSEALVRTKLSGMER